MERPSNIDELMRKRLQHAEVPPPAFVWKNVERRLHRRKRRFFLWLFAATCLAGIGIWSLWPHPGQFVPAERGGAIAPSTTRPLDAPVPEAVPAAGHSPVAEGSEQGGSSSGRFPRQPGTGAPAPSFQQKQELPGAPASTAVLSTEAAALSAGEQLMPAGLTPLSAGLLRKSPGSPPDFLPGRPALLTAGPAHPEFPVVPPPQTPKKTPRKCYDFHANRQAWLIDVYAGPSLVQKQLDSNDPEFKDYVQDRNRTEQHQWAFNGGVRASYLFAENFMVRTGLHVDYLVEQFEYIDPNFIKYTVVITQKLVNGQWVTVPDTVDVEYGANYVKTYNRFTLLDLPLQAALELRSGPTGISLNLGGSVNLLFRKKGSILTLDGKPASFTPDEQEYDVFRPRVGLSLLGSIQWYYHLTPRTRVFAEPYYRRILEPVTRSGYPVDQAYGIGGLRLGLTQILD